MRSVSRIFFPSTQASTPGITRSALRIPVLMGPNPGRWSYGVMAVLDERHGMSNHAITPPPPLMFVCWGLWCCCFWVLL